MWQRLFAPAQAFSENDKSRCCLLSDKENVRSRAQAGSMKKNTPTPDMTVDQVMNRWPASIRVFMDFRMGCVGCPIATFHSIDEASREHDIDGGAFLAELQAAAR
jgi:hybrid cluster-associated redox disulfide protein